MSDNSEADRTGLEIAVIGMSCRFPGAPDLERFWDNLKNGVESISFFSKEELLEMGTDPQLLDNPDFVPARGLIENVEHFDATFFGYKASEAEVMDPQIRILYECTWEALESAGYDPFTYDGLIGLYAGANNNRGWEYQSMMSRKAERLGTFVRDHLVDRDFISTRLAYKLNLKGPAVTMKTACSTALVAVDMACRAILTGQCDMALAGGVTVASYYPPGYINYEGMIFSSNGHCRAFDADADGVLFSDGGGAVLLKRLDEAIDDGDTIHAVVLGTAVNNDGIRKGTFEAPCIEGQAEVIEAALHMAEVEPETITYVETHGTGTEIGDPIEIEGLKKAFNTDKKGYCPIGSVKSNFGHLDTAAGMAGLIKTILSLKNRQIPPSLHFKKPNPKIDFENSPFYVNAQLSQWEANGSPLRAGVSSFGIGGTNSHVVLEEAPQPVHSSQSRKRQMIMLSAGNETALDAASENLEKYINQNPNINLADAAYTLQVGRRRMKCRKVWVMDIDEPDFSMPHSAVAREKNRPIFMFTGQGAQYVNMGKDLYQTEPRFRKIMDQCFDILKTHSTIDMKSILYPGNPGEDTKDSSVVNHTEVTQPLLFIIEYALARLLMDWGIEPHAMIGHSIGEYTAACLAGVFSLEDALKIVALRGKLMQQMPAGSMLTVALPEAELAPMLTDYPELSIAAVNAPSLCVVSGPHESVDAFEEKASGDGHRCKRLHTSHAFHSAMMDPVLSEFEAAIAAMTLNKPQRPYISNLTGQWITAEEAVSPAYWSAHLRNAVRFCDGLNHLVKEPEAIFIEVGPGRSLSTLVNKHDGKQIGHMVVNLIKHPKDDSPDDYFLFGKLGQMWLYGIDIDWAVFYEEENRHRIQLPHYPFQRIHYTMDRTTADLNQAAGGKRPSVDTGKKTDLSQWFYAPSWKPSVPPTSKTTDAEETKVEHWLFFVEDGSIGHRVAMDIRGTSLAEADSITLVSPGEDFSKSTINETTAAAGSGKKPSNNTLNYILNPAAPDHYQQLIAQLKQDNRVPTRVVHTWTAGDDAPNDGDGQSTQWDVRIDDRAFYSLVYLAQAIGKEEIAGDIALTVVTSQVQDVTGSETIVPQKAGIFGPAQVIPLEYPNIHSRVIDIVPPTNGGGEARLVSQLITELNAQPAQTAQPCPVIAYRNHHRLERSYDPVPLNAPLEGSGRPVPRLREGGVYLITGGLGGIGLEMARHLATTVNARLVLVGRSELPSPDQWQQWLDTHSPDDRTSKKIIKIQELKTNGTDVEVMSADVTDANRMAEVIRDAESRLGPINGVIHAAGVPGGGMIALKKRDEADNVMLPKVKGALVLDTLFKNRDLDFFVLCSSINSVVPVMGQVDYFAANACLDAFAGYITSQSNIFSVSINWDTWQEVGMAVEAAALRAGIREIGHPLLERCIFDKPHKKTYETLFALDRQWALSEHLIASTKQGLLPGVTYLEMARRAYADHAGTEDIPIEISDVYFLNPMIVGEGESRVGRLTLEKSGDGFDFSVESQHADSNSGQWLKHTVGKITKAADTGTEQKNHNLESITAQCTKLDRVISIEEGIGRRSGALSFGLRWEQHQRLQLGEKMGMVHLQLSDSFASDLDVYKLHPAILDVGAAFLYTEVANGTYIPFSYKKLIIHAPLTAAVLSYARAGEGRDPGTGRDALKFDVIIMDREGRELVQISEFTMVRVAEDMGAKVQENVKETGTDTGTGTDTPTDMAESGEIKSPGKDGSAGKVPKLLKNGILPSEGIDVFNRILGGIPAQVVVSTTDLLPRIERSRMPDIVEQEDAGPELEATPVATAPRPEISSVYVSPKTDIERKIAENWQSLLGIEKIGIHDDFFELGGDSLNVVQLNNQLKKSFDKDIPVAVMFQYQTIHAFAQYLESNEKSSATAQEEDRSQELAKGKNRLKARIKRR